MSESHSRIGLSESLIYPRHLVPLFRPCLDWGAEVPQVAASVSFGGSDHYDPKRADVPAASGMDVVRVDRRTADRSYALGADTLGVSLGVASLVAGDCHQSLQVRQTAYGSYVAEREAALGSMTAVEGQVRSYNSRMSYGSSCGRPFVVHQMSRCAGS